MTDTTKLITELEELMAKATPGPWRFDYAHPPDCYLREEGQGWPIAGMWGKVLRPNMEHDASFIVAMRNYLPELIAKIKELDSLLTGSAEETRQSFSALYHAANTTIPELENERDAAIARAEKAEVRLNEILCAELEDDAAAERIRLRFDNEGLCSALDAAIARAERAERDALATRLIGEIRTEQIQAERDEAMRHLPEECPFDCGFDRPGWCDLQVESTEYGDCGCSVGTKPCWSRFIAHEAAKRDAGEEV